MSLTDLAGIAALPPREAGIKLVANRAAAVTSGNAVSSAVQQLLSNETDAPTKTELNAIQAAMLQPHNVTYTTTNPAVAQALVGFGWLQQVPTTTPGQFRYEVTTSGRNAARANR